jgi:hypothetical protein
MDKVAGGNWKASNFALQRANFGQGRPRSSAGWIKSQQEKKVRGA